MPKRIGTQSPSLMVWKRAELTGKRGLPGWSLLLVIAGLLAGGAWLGAGSADAQDGGPRPAAPTNLAVAPGATEATLTWSPGTGSDCATTRYNVSLYHSKDGYVTYKEVAPSGDKTSSRFTNLSPSTGYSLEVYAFGASCGKYSSSPGTIKFTTLASSEPTEDESTPTPTATPTLTRPATPTNLHVVPGATEATFTWSQGTGSSCVVDKYLIRLYEFSTARLQAGARVLSPKKSWRVTGLTPSTKYEFEIYAQSASCDQTNSFDGVTRFTTLAADREQAPTPPAEGAQQEELTISVSDTSVAEGDSGRTNMTFTITLSGTPSHKVQVRATARGVAIKARRPSPPTATGLADPGRDFIRFTDRNIMFEAGATGDGLTKTVTVKILGDTVAEGDETVSLRVNNLRTDDDRVMFANGKKRIFVTGTIRDDDSD